MDPNAQLTSLLRGELTDLISASCFLFIGFIALAIAAIRRRGGVRVLVWIGLWSFLFGSNMLAQSAAVSASLPPSLESLRALWVVSCTYLTIVAAALAFLELTLGKLRFFMFMLLSADLLVAIAGIGSFVHFGQREQFLLWNQVLAVVGLVVLLTTLSVPRLSQRFLVLSRHRVLTVATFIFAAEALWVNLSRPFNNTVPSIYSSLGFAVLLLAFAYTALDMILGNERRLLAIDNELKIARDLQFSILPDAPPKLATLEIAAAYEPMTSVAGDFYEFLPFDNESMGFLVADVSGHGVPAALIASMIKVGTQSLNGCAGDPGEVLRRLGNILNKNLRGQTVSAAYLWIDTASRRALYSAAGHPPVLRWSRDSRSLSRIESNGLIFGVIRDATYPVCEIPLASGDRFLLYTDGLTEAEDSSGQQFGDRRLEDVLRDGQSLSASELVQSLLAELQRSRPLSVPQQDDITLVVIDVL